MQLRDQPSRSDDRFRRAAVDLRMWDGVGMVEPRNIRRARDTSKPAAISLLAFGGCSYGWRAMSSGCAVSRYLDYSSFQTVIARLHGDVLNARDMDQQRRGYYEELDVGRTDNWRGMSAEEPEGWSKGKKAFYPRAIRLFADRHRSIDEHGSRRRPMHVQFPGHA